MAPAAMVHGNALRRSQETRPKSGPGTPARANLLIVPTFDSSITSDPNAATIEAGINAAIARVEAHILNPLTVNITFQVGSIGGGVLGTSNAAPAFTDYDTYHSALQTA